LRRDFHRGYGEVGEWGICGSNGHIYRDGDGFLIYVTTGERKRRWTNVRRRLSFCRVTQDGDDEGYLRLDHLPDASEAKRLREAVGLRWFSHQRRAHLNAIGMKGRFSAQHAAKPAPGTGQHPGENKQQKTEKTGQPRR
jgi:hypothetical protein